MKGGRKGSFTRQDLALDAYNAPYLKNGDNGASGGGQRQQRQQRQQQRKLYYHSYIDGYPAEVNVTVLTGDGMMAGAGEAFYDFYYSLAY
jgi:hypothetical protein